MWDTVTPVEEMMRSLDDVVRAGKVLYIGISDAPAWIVSRAQTWAECKSITPFAAIQLEYNLVERTVERDLLPMAEDLNLSILDWSPLGGGVLTGKYLNADLGTNHRLNLIGVHSPLLAAKESDCNPNLRFGSKTICIPRPLAAG
jgi:aryl-alcohol dehydrogenase-like predicted oxidoreductase